MNELTNMKAAASQHPGILSPKHGQTGDVKPLRANRSLPFAVSVKPWVRFLFLIFDNLRARLRFGQAYM